jgi:predicted molibdopterin-dependent oxidoreductase YjgC
VAPKDAGPLISMQEMSRCIQCTRCVRFGQEIAGVMEFGMVGRGEHSEITTFVGKTVNSELSGNMIDLCPVGALTSKPFRYSARTWELSRRKSVSPHDGLGANLVVQVKSGKVMRVLPLENNDVNECWLSDKDRFAYEGLNSAERLTKPMLKQDGKWQEVEWQTALEYVAHGLRHCCCRHSVFDAGRIVAAAKSDARPGLGKHRFPPAPVRLRAGWQGHAMAGHVDQRIRTARPYLHHRLVPAQGSSAAVGASTPGHQARRQAEYPARN